MLRWLRWRSAQKVKRRAANVRAAAQAADAGAPDFVPALFLSVKANLQNIKHAVGQAEDLVVREITLGQTGIRCGIACIDGLIDKKMINDQVLRNIQLYATIAGKPHPANGEEAVSLLEAELLSTYQVTRASTLDDVMLSVLSGDTALFVDGSNVALIIDSKGWESRGIEEPQTESLIRGPKEGFTENIRTNMALIRRRIRDVNLRFKTYKIGRRAKKDVTLCYIDGIVHPQLLAEIERRVLSIDMDDAEGSGYIEQWIADSFLTPFPLIINTERPDKVSAALLQGKAALLVDGTPFQLIMPMTFASMLRSPEDYYEHWLIASLIRMLRLIAAFASTFMPALYIALVEFHHGMIPSKLAFSIAGTREGVPFPAVVEAFIMEGTLELLREAGLRLPKPIGQTIGIVGGLVIGEAAVSAGIVSPIMVIIVAVTAISSFTLPSYAFSISLRMLRFAVMLAAAVFGLYGIILAYIMINIHLVNLTSFGVPYSAPFAPFFARDWKDLIVRMPPMELDKRPQVNQPADPDRLNK